MKASAHMKKAVESGAKEVRYTFVSTSLPKFCCACALGMALIDKVGYKAASRIACGGPFSSPFRNPVRAIGNALELPYEVASEVNALHTKGFSARAIAGWLEQAGY